MPRPWRLRPPRRRDGRFVNWARTEQASPRVWRLPRTEQQVLDLVSAARVSGRRLRVVGAGHSWSPVAVPEHVAVSLDHLGGRVAVDDRAGTVTAPAGTRLRDLTATLGRRGLALPIVGSIQSQSLAGAIATGTHGSSLRYGNLGTLVTAVRLVTGTGEVVTIDGADDRLAGLRVHLGALGALTSMTLVTRPARRLHQTVEHVPATRLGSILPEVAGSAEYAKIWWFPHAPDAQVVRYEATDAPLSRRPSVASRRRFDEEVMQRAVFPAMVTLMHGRPGLNRRVNRWLSHRYLGPRSQVGPDMLILNTSMPLRHRETEAALPLDRAGAALDEVVALFGNGRPAVDMPLEVRFVRGDGSWLSPAYGADTCQIGAYATDGPDTQGYFDAFWAVMRAAGARPHWGKEFEHSVDELRPLYPDFDRFAALRDELDPDRVFGSGFHTGILGP